MCSFPNCGGAFAQHATRARHFNSMHTEEGQQRHKIQEEKVAKALTDAGICFKREHHVDLKCFGGTFAREDFVVDHASGGIISIEVDEQQHAGQVQCDLKRTQDIRNALLVSGNSLPRLLIRYNPNAFTVDGETQIVLKKRRESRLVKFIKSFSFAGAPDFQMLYMYFDAHHNKSGDLLLDIWSDPDYLDEYRSVCLKPCIRA